MSEQAGEMDDRAWAEYWASHTNFRAGWVQSCTPEQFLEWQARFYAGQPSMPNFHVGSAHLP